MGVKVIEEARTILLSGEIDDKVAEEVCLALLTLEAQGDGDISLWINSPGGSVAAGFMVIDTMQAIGPDVETVNVGLACSMGALLLMGGSKGKRKALPHSRVMIHQPISIGQGALPASDLEIQAREVGRVKKEAFEYMSECTGRSTARIAEDCDRNRWLDARESLKYGIIDVIITPDAR